MKNEERTTAANSFRNVLEFLFGAKVFDASLPNWRLKRKEIVTRATLCFS
jgi:hypothetical protein